MSGRSIRLSLPLYLGDKDGEARAEEAEHQPYRELPVTVIVQIPSITIHPPQILLTPVPLENSAVATLTLLAVGYPRLFNTHTHTFTVFSSPQAYFFLFCSFDLVAVSCLVELSTNNDRCVLCLHSPGSW